MPSSVLVLEDDPRIRGPIERHLARRGVGTVVTESVAQARAAAASGSFDAMLLDLHLPDGEGFEVLDGFPLSKRPPTIIMTGTVTVEMAVRALRGGASDFLAKPFMMADIDVALARVLSDPTPHSSSFEPGAADEWRRRFAPDVLGNHPSLMHVFDVLRRVADSDCSVLVRGDTGTGKELLARAIHNASGRGRGQFIALNCAAVPEQLIESELFGHAKGAFTGATSARVGCFAAANGGTLLLDEIGELPLPMQAKLLRTLQERQVTPVGETRAVPIDVRVVAATHRDLEKMVEDHTFREDLLYRLDVIRVELPALRERGHDIPELVDAFIRGTNARRGRAVDGVSPRAMSMLAAYPWPGNVRQLQNFVERTVLMRGEGTIDVGDLPEKVREHAQSSGATPARERAPLLPTSGIDLRDAVEGYENALIRQALERSGWNKNQAAAMLRLNRTTLVEKLKKRGWSADEPMKVGAGHELGTEVE